MLVQQAASKSAAPKGNGRITQGHPPPLQRPMRAERTTEYSLLASVERTLFPTPFGAALMATTIKLTVNGKPRELHTDDPSMPLLYALRDELGLHGLPLRMRSRSVRRVHGALLREALRCCVMPISAWPAPRSSRSKGSALPRNASIAQAFIDEQAAQCGYCINGMIMQAAAFLATTKRRPKSRSDRRSRQPV